MDVEEPPPDTWKPWREPGVRPGEEAPAVQPWRATAGDARGGRARDAERGVRVDAPFGPIHGGRGAVGGIEGGCDKKVAVAKRAI